MPCKKQIKENIKSFTRKEGEKALGKSLKLANQNAARINNLFRENVISYAMEGDLLTMNISEPSSDLIDIYYNNELQQEAEASRKQHMEDAKRAGMDYSDDYLYSPASIHHTPGNIGPTINFSTYVSRVDALIDLTDNKIKVLSRLSKTPERQKNIEKLKNLRSSLKFEKKELVKSGYAEKTLMDNISKSFDMVDEYLLNDPSITDLVLSKNFLNLLENLLVGGNIIPNDSSLKDTKGFTIARSRLGRIQQSYQEKARNKALELIDMTEDELEKIDKDQDISFFTKQVFAIDMVDDTHPITDKIKETYDKISSNSETTEMNESLFNYKSTLEKEMKDNNHSYGDVFFEVGLRLKSKLSNNWELYKSNVTNSLQKITDDIFNMYKKGTATKAQWKAINKRLRQVQNTSSFVNIALLLGPQLSGEYKILSNIPQQESDAYRQKLLDRLAGNTKNYELAEELLHDFESEGHQKISEYQAALEAERLRLSLKEGTDDETSWSDSSKDSFERKKQTESPFTIGYEMWRKKSKNVGVDVKLSDGNVYNVQHSLKNQVLFPRESHINQEFEQDIESNATYLKAWKMMKEHQEYIHANSTSANNSPLDLIADSDFLNGQEDTLIRVIGKLPKKFKQWVKKQLSIKRNQTTKKDKNLDNLKVYGNQKTIFDAVSKEINTIYKPYVTAIYGKGSWTGKPTKNMVESLSKKIGISSEDFNAYEPVALQIRDLLTKKYIEHQNTDYIESLLAQTKLAEKMKNQKEAENEVLFLFNVLKQEVPNRTREIDFASQYIKQAVFQEKYLGDKGALPTGPKIATYFSNASLQEIEAIKETIKELESQSLNAEGMKLLQEMKEALDNKGRPITPKSSLYSMLFQFELVRSLGWNVKTQIFNKIAGDTVSRASDGVKWTRGNFRKAKALIARGRTKKYFSRDSQYARNIDQILDMLNVYQDAKNEIYKIKEKRTKSMLKNVTQPLNLVTETEKLIQKPQILSLLGDMTISAPGQATVPVIDLNSPGNPHPAFEFDTNLGVIKLKKAYATPENRATWENRNSQEYADNFGESGTVPYTIAELNSDYRDNSFLLAKQSGAGVAALFFKRFMLSYMYLRYGKNGMYRKLVEEGMTNNLISSLASNMMYSTIPGFAVAGSMGIAPAFLMGGAGVLATAAIAGTIVGGKQIRQWKSDMKKHVEQLSMNQKIMELLKLVGSNLVNLGKFQLATALKMIQAKGEYFTGKELFNDKFILDFSGISKEDMSEEVEARMNYVLHNSQRTLSIFLVKAILLSLFAPDEDEEKRYRKLQKISKTKAISEEFDVALYYAAVNAFNRTLDDHLVVDSPSLIKDVLDLPIVDKVMDTGKIGISLSEYMISGESPVLNSGPNQGRKKIDVQLEDALKPVALEGLGFFSLTNIPASKTKAESLATKSDYDIIDKQRKNRMKEYRKDRMEFWDSRGYSLEKAEIKVNKEVSKKYGKSTLRSSYFKSDGTLTKYGEKRLKKLGYTIP